MAEMIFSNCQRMFEQLIEYYESLPDRTYVEQSHYEVLLLIGKTNKYNAIMCYLSW